jgi:hypothetical protein
MKVNSSRLTQGLSTPFLKGTGPEIKFKSAPRAGLPPPPDPGVDLCITQLCGEGTIRTTWPRIHPHGHFLLTEWLIVAADKGPHPSALLAATTRGHQIGVVACEGPSGPHRTPIWVDGRGDYYEHGERRVGIVPKKHSFCHPTEGLDIRR